MSLTGPDFWSPDKGTVMATAVGHTCFLCGSCIARDPAWTWAGATGQVWCHPGCAGDLMLRIGHDLVRWQKNSGRSFHHREANE